jgi:adenosylcobinamide-GDP ribazoletransferase
LRGVRASFVFLSRLPLGGFPYDSRDWHWAPAHFPLVGAVIGAACALVFSACAALSLGRPFAATLVLLTSVWLTGAFHEDGLADSADGLGGAHGGAKRALEIMKDSRIGTYGAAALVLSLMVRGSAIAELDPSAWFALVYVHCVARVGPVWLMATEPSVSDSASTKSPLFDTRRVHVATALCWAAACTALAIFAGGLRWTTVLGVTITSGVITKLCARYFRRAVGGVTGDLLGATEQLCEIGAWVTLLCTLSP